MADGDADEDDGASFLLTDNGDDTDMRLERLEVRRCWHVTPWCVRVYACTASALL
jgi:hypothetical protein